MASTNIWAGKDITPKNAAEGFVARLSRGKTGPHRINKHFYYSAANIACRHAYMLPALSISPNVIRHF